MEEQGNEDCIWKLKITDPSTRCYNFSWKTEGEDGKNILVETIQEEVKKGTLWRLTSAVCVAVGFPVSLITHVAVLNSLLLCAGEPKL